MENGYANNDAERRNDAVNESKKSEIRAQKGDAPIFYVDQTSSLLF